MGAVGRLWGSLSCGRRRPNLEACPVDGHADGNGICPAFSSKSSSSGIKRATPAEQEKAKALKEVGNDHFRRQDFEEALDAYTEAAEMNMMDGSVWLNRSIVNRQLENWEDASNDAEIAMEIDPSNPKAYYSFALALRALGEKTKALAVCKRGLTKASDNKALIQLRRDLEKDPAKKVNSAEACPAAKLGDMTATIAKERAEAMAYEWKKGNPDKKERKDYKKMMTDLFRSKYEELAQRSAEHKSKRSPLEVSQYEESQKNGLQLTGGHRPMARPDITKLTLPADFKQQLGVMSVEDMAKYGCDNPDNRFLLSIYGNIFDVSDRPDKYNAEGPYSCLTGKDLTWGLFAGVDTVEYTNRFYDLFKGRDLGKDKLSGVCSWLAWYETEYGPAVGQCEPWLREDMLPAPPIEEIEDNCCVM